MKKRINMIPESNGLYRVNMKEKVSKIKILKRITLAILLIFLAGFIFQYISNFIGKERISSGLYYAKVNNTKIEYENSGSGDYTIVFDGDLGTGLQQWRSLTDILEKELGVKTFIYNRSGYGFSAFNEKRTIKEQAEDLKILLRKAGVSGNLILVGEKYGSLIMTNFAQLFPEDVSGMLLIRPLNEKDIKSEKYKKDNKWTYYKSKLEKIGTYFGLTSLLDYFDLDYSVKAFEESLDEYSKEEYDILNTKTNYRKAIENELGNLFSYEESSQIDGLMSGKPLYIISNDENDELFRLGDSELTTIYKTKSKEELISTTDEEAITAAISNILRERKKIDKNSN